MKPRSSLRIASLLVAASVPILGACAHSVDDEFSVPGVFESTITSHDVCIETRCPSPFATCDGVAGVCTVNLGNDPEHCGSCDTACPSPTSKTHGRYLCGDGQCHLACAPLYADCNNSETDGCEVWTDHDPANCGSCGNTCADGVICWMGACGCPKGFTQCGNDCKRTDSDNDNCGACGTKCKAPDDDSDPRWICGPRVEPDNTKWQCGAAACKLQCKPGFGDCNHDFCGDGCEIDLRSDPANCGACGNACAAGQTCKNGQCLCPAGTVSCFGECVDTNTDVTNCGDCGVECPGPASTSGRGSPTCEGGKCGYTCFPGFADCDGRIENGCESNIATSQKHCGGCNTQCDIANGQPCVGGVCLTRPCQDPVIK